MRAPRLGVGLVLLGATLVALTVLALTASATRVLRQIAEQQALSAALRETGRVTESAARAADDAAAAARVLSERPTLRRLLERDARAEEGAFLETYRRGAGLSSAAVVVDGSIAASAGDPPPPGAVALAAGRVRTALRVTEDGRIEAAAFEDVPDRPGTTVIASLALDPSDGAAGGTQVSVLARDAAAALPFGPRSPILEEALREGRSAAARADEAFVAAAPLRSAGEIAAVVLAEVPASHARLAERTWVAEVRRIALVVLVIAVVASFAMARTLAAPLERLGRAAERIGLGDLETPVPAGPGGEVGTLARTMEDMRVSLRETTARLRQSRAESEAVLAGMHEGVFDVDGDRRVRYLNPHLAQLLGTTTEAAAGRFCGDVLGAVGADGRPPCEDSCPILEARAGASARAVEHVAVAGGGGRRTVVITSAAPVEGRQIQLVHEESDAEAGRRLRDAVLANLTHEFRTPLAAQLASLEMLRDRLDSLRPEETRQLVQSMERGAVRLTRLVDNLLESARLETGEDAIRRRPVALDDVLEEAVETMRPLFEQRGQRMELQLPPSLPRVEGDAPRLVQVFVNLLANANKFAPEGTAVRVGAAAERGNVTLWVEDDGPGLPEGDDTIFERFGRRADGEPEQGGLGLGLWIARSIVERHGGRLHADAGARGAGERGARLVVILPEGAA